MQLGQAFDPSIFGIGNVGDLTFEFATPGGGAILGEVTYVQSLPGDFDHNMVVDGGDFLVWQRGFPEMYDASDLADWEANYGSSGGSVTAMAVVPEPSTLGAVALVLLISSCCRCALCLHLRRRSNECATHCIRIGSTFARRISLLFTHSSP